jgi:hypothetical protein
MQISMRQVALQAIWVFQQALSTERFVAAAPRTVQSFMLSHMVKETNLVKETMYNTVDSRNNRVLIELPRAADASARDDVAGIRSAGFEMARRWRRPA